MQLAVVGRARLLVSGDRDFLALAAGLRRTCGCTILPPDEFLRVNLSGAG